MSSTPFPIELSDGARNELSLFKAEQADAPLILLFPALGVRASFYKTFAPALRDQGFHVCTADWRGLGKSSVRASAQVDFGYKELVEDMGDIIQKVKAEFSDSSQTFLLGHSLGGQIGSMYISRFPDEIDGLILCASCMVYYKGWEGQGIWKTKLAVRLFPLIAKMIGYFPGKQIGFGGKEARTVMQDWGYNGMTGKYAPQGDPFDYESALAKTTIPVLAMSMEGDTFAPKRAVSFLYEKFYSSSDITHHHITPSEAGVEKLNHYLWAKHPDFFVRTIRDWIQAQV